MKMTKKISSFIAALLLATTFNTQSMEQPSRNNLGWVAIVGGVLLGAVAIKMLWQSNEPFSFASLPKDIRDQIIYLLSLSTTAASLKEAAKNINSLAHVNKELNAFINDPKFCLNVIKHLAQKFNCSDQETAEALHTKEAKRRLELQTKLQRLCVNGDPKNEFKDLCLQGVDLSFVYYFNTFHIHNRKFFYTPLIGAINDQHFYLACDIIDCGINNNLDIVNQTSPAGKTPLLSCIEKTVKLNGARYAYSKNKYVGKKIWPIYFDCLDTIKYLLGHGANPELADVDGLTPLEAAKQTANQEIIDLVQDAINKKHGKK